MLPNNLQCSGQSSIPTYPHPPKKSYLPPNGSSTTVLKLWSGDNGVIYHVSQDNTRQWQKGKKKPKTTSEFSIVANNEIAKACPSLFQSLLGTGNSFCSALVIQIAPSHDIPDSSHRFQVAKAGDAGPGGLHASFWMLQHRSDTSHFSSWPHGPEQET